MSIPPLVCSTPPPPDQCDEERETDDFVMSYSVSQEEDDTYEYDYHGFPSYDYYNTAKPTTTPQKTSSIGLPSADENLVIEPKKYSENHCKMKEIIENSHNEIMLNVNSPSDESYLEVDSEKACDSDKATFQEHSISSECEVSKDVVVDCNTPKTTDENFIAVLSEECDTIDVNVFHQLPKEDVVSYETCRSESLHNEQVEDSMANSDDDFRDFDDPKSGSTKILNEVTHVPEVNPWDNQTSAEDKINFDANFDDYQTNFDSQEVKEPNASLQETCPDNENDDDFGDFDDFQSNTAHLEESKRNSEVDTLSIHSSINDHVVHKVLSSIFKDEIDEVESNMVDNLEISLKETWRQLKETEIRQPYIIQWNNSNGQKVLLKSLNIDSRNILFAPKWSHNTPKYAANLGAAPLQPQSLKPSPAQEVISSTENTTNKSDTWVDPFTSNGQEFTYAEALLLDLEHLMASLDQMAQNKQYNVKISDLLSQACGSTDNMVKPEPETKLAPCTLGELPSATKSADKTYSKTMIQPIRQYNLPDTHIYTPSDSETPRSKTIHYDTSTMIIPETKVIENPITDDFDDFQDFKAAAPPANVTTETNANIILQSGSLVPTSKTFDTQILEPVKIEPVMPTLNWPDPGEIKTTFDDFSDFISNSPSWTKDLPAPSVNPIEESQPAESVTQESTHTNLNCIQKLDDVVNNLDDEFESFQTAIPQSKGIPAMDKFNNTHVSYESISLPPTHIENTSTIDSSSLVNSKESSLKKAVTNSISNNQAPTEAKRQLESPQLKPRPSNSTLSRTSMLQPLPASGLPAQKNMSGQILQPLSLESYSSINWPSPGADLQDLSRFNPIETLPSLKTELPSSSKTNSPAHSAVKAQALEDDGWGEFVSSPACRKVQNASTKAESTFVDDDEWSDFVSGSSTKAPNGVNTISFNVHANKNSSKYAPKNVSVEIPSLNYITPKTTQQQHKAFTDKHLNL